MTTQELLLGTGNPKAIVLFAAVFPQFIGAGSMMALSHR